ncbi:MAG: HU family DNA-binding protein [Pseudomonadota bacterium]
MAVRKKKAVKKVAARKTTTKKVAAKKTAAPRKKVATKGTDRPGTAIKEKYTKTQILTELAESTELSKKQVSDVIDGLTNIIERHVKKRAVGEFTLPGLLKISTTRKPATKARKGINPFTGEETVFQAKPARTVVKIRPLKKLKEMVE